VLAEENTRLVQSAYEAFGRGDMAAFAEVMADDIEWGVACDCGDVARSARRQLVGADIKAFDVSGSSTTLPSGVILGLFAMIGSWADARYGFSRPSSIR
jgi:hypothetical protein